MGAGVDLLPHQQVKSRTLRRICQYLYATSHVKLNCWTYIGKSLSTVRCSHSFTHLIYTHCVDNQVLGVKMCHRRPTSKVREDMCVLTASLFVFQNPAFLHYERCRFPSVHLVLGVGKHLRRVGITSNRLRMICHTVMSCILLLGHFNLTTALWQNQKRENM